VGKTALLGYAAEEASGFRVLRATGIQTESELAFAALHQLLAQDLAGLDRLPEPQADALRGALGLVSTQRREPFLIAAGVLSLLADLAEASPVLCLIDDAQWLDDPSASALQFTARRIEAERIVMVFAVREGDENRFDAPGLLSLAVPALDEVAARELLEQQVETPLADSVREQLVEHANGNPLALVELAGSLTPEQLSGRQALADPLTLGAGLQNAYAAHLDRLPPETRLLLVVAAAEDSGDVASILRAGHALQLETAALEPAERDGLVSVVDGHLAFRHPLVRSAVYQGATFAQRRDAHTALAAVLQAGNEDRRAWHRAAAAEGPDEAIAGDLEASAERAALRGGYTAAASALEKAATLTPDVKRRTLRFLAAADAAWMAGRGERARALLSDASRVAPAELGVDVTKLRGRIEVRSGNFDAAMRMLLSAAQALAPSDPAIALRLLAEAEEATIYTGDAEAAIEIGMLVEQLARDAPDLADRVVSKSIVAFARAFSGHSDEAAPLLREALAAAEMSDDLDQVLVAIRAADVLGDEPAAIDFGNRAIRIAHERGAPGALPLILERVSFIEFRLGRYASARMHAAEGLRMAHETGQETGALLCILALVAAVQGREDECRSSAADAIERALERQAGVQRCAAMWAIGLLELGLGRPQEAFAALESVLPGKNVLTHRFIALWLTPDLIEAAVRAQKIATAESALTAFEEWARGVGEPWALALLCHCRGLVATGERAEREFTKALALHSESSRPFAHARTELAFGEVLRRNRKRREARDHLRAAITEFERLGAAPWEERTRKELRASGETARKRDPSTLGDLTPQELQIARLVATGVRNRQVAAQLFLSPRTIDYHLRKVFMKLGISSRAELAQLDLADAAR
jgi:DNA-binding CsgD family transcriptional regulator